MSVTFTLTTPATIGSLGNQITVTSLQLTSISYSSTPALAQIGTGQLNVTLTDPSSGYQETIKYQDASVLTFWAATASLASTGTLGDTLAAATFNKLIADGKLPAGALSTSTAAGE